jgi:hypothetical protein
MEVYFYKKAKGHSKIKVPYQSFTFQKIYELGVNVDKEHWHSHGREGIIIITTIIIIITRC